MRFKIIILVLLALSLTFVGANSALAVDATANVTLSATVTSIAELTLSTATVSFPNANPGTVPNVSATENGATITAHVRTGSSTPASLSVLAADDLTSGSDVIPMTAVSSTTTNTSGTFFTTGAIPWSKTAPVTLGGGASGSYTGTVNWTLANSWSYATGNYTAAATYTLTAP